MSIDFDSAALQTQHDEEEYDQEDYAREQELQKLLTDLPDDMLEDSRDSSSPELEHSTCSNKNTGSSPPSQWNQQWPVKPRPTAQKVYEANFEPHPPDDYAYEDKRPQINGHHFHPESQPVSQAFSQQPQDNCYVSYGSIDAEQSMETNDFSTAEYGVKRYPQGTENAVMFNGGRLGDINSYGNHVQDSKDRVLDQYKATYNPHNHDLQPKMFNPHDIHRDGHMDQLQREFLDSTQQTADKERLAQLQILHKAQQRQIEDLERKLEDSRRNMRFVEHQFAIVKDEKEGLAVSQKESNRVIEEAKEREAQMQNKLKALEQQVKVLTERDHENIKKQRVAEAAVDSMKQQMVDLCRSDTLSRARQQHDRDLTVMKEQHSAALLTLQQKLDSTAQALDEQVDVDRRLREQVKQLEQKREEEQLERARVVNGLTQRLEESQQQCAKLLESTSVQETTQIQIKLQQAQSAKTLCENMNKVLQEDLADLKEQITMYESAVKHGVIGMDLSEEWENQLSDSCMDLGLKKANRKNGLLLSPALARLSDSKLPKDDALRQLRAEMQRCLGSLKGKRQKISQLQEELQLCQGRVSELQGQLDEAKLSTQVREMSQVKRLDATAESQENILRVQEENRVLQEQVEALEKKNKELKQNEDKLRLTNSELCTKMREMIEELDQEKQEASARTERINQQHRDDVVNWLRQEHEANVAQLTAKHQQQLLHLQTQLSEANDNMLAVQECYISVCKEKDMLEQREHSRREEETQMKENEKNIKEESAAALEKLRAELEDKHQVAVNQLKAAWSKDKEAEIKQQVESQVALDKAAWEEKLGQMEQAWELRLEEARSQQREMVEAACQGDQSVSCNSSKIMVTAEELESRLAAQKQQLQLEAERLRQKAMEESRKSIQRELHKKHLEDMAKQVEGAVTRAYSRWVDDLTSLPEYQTLLQTEREKWEELQEKRTEQRMSGASKKVEVQSSGLQREKELEEEVTDLQTQLEQMRKEQAALLKAELAAARAAWNRDKQQELSAVQLRFEQACQGKLQEQGRKLEQALQQAKEEQKKELLLQTEAKLLQRTEEQRQRIRGELLAELHAALAEVQAHVLASERADEQGDSSSSNSSSNSSVGAAASEGSVTHIIQTSCRDAISRAVSQAKDQWRKMSEERLGRVLQETQQQQVREIAKMQSSLAQARCRKECGETVDKLQKKNQELQRHLEKACRQLQHCVQEHKTAVKRLKEEHESSLEKAKEEHQQRLGSMKRAKESSGASDHQQSLQRGLEEMKQQYLTTVEKIRGDMLRYLQESRERAAEMIRSEVQRERQATARKMRRYYLTCLQELLEDGGKSAGAEKKIMHAASKLAAMAKVLETPVKSKPEKIFSSQSKSEDCLLGRPLALDSGPRAPTPEETLSPSPASAEQKLCAPARTDTPSNQERPAGPMAQSATDARPHKPSPSLGGRVKAPPSNKRRDLGQHHGSKQNRALLQEAPVRDERRSDWSLASSDSEAALHVPHPSWPERRAEPLEQFPACAGDQRDFGGFTPSVSNVTVYKDIATKTPRGNMSPHRQPTPGSEAGSQLGAPCRPPYSELRQRQQDSGFDSPFCQQK